MLVYCWGSKSPDASVLKRRCSHASAEMERSVLSSLAVAVLLLLPEIALPDDGDKFSVGVGAMPKPMQISGLLYRGSQGARDSFFILAFASTGELGNSRVFSSLFACDRIRSVTMASFGWSEIWFVRLFFPAETVFFFHNISIRIVFFNQFQPSFRPANGAYMSI